MFHRKGETDRILVRNNIINTITVRWLLGWCHTRTKLHPERFIPPYAFILYSSRVYGLLVKSN